MHSMLINTQGHRVQGMPDCPRHWPFTRTHPQRRLLAQAKAAVDLARKQTAGAINCTPQELFFTSCGTGAWVSSSSPQLHPPCPWSLDDSRGRQATPHTQLTQSSLVPPAVASPESDNWIIYGAVAAARDRWGLTPRAPGAPPPPVVGRVPHVVCRWGGQLAGCALIPPTSGSLSSPASPYLVLGGRFCSLVLGMWWVWGGGAGHCVTRDLPGTHAGCSSLAWIGQQPGHAPPLPPRREGRGAAHRLTCFSFLCSNIEHIAVTAHLTHLEQQVRKAARVEAISGVCADGSFSACWQVPHKPLPGPKPLQGLLRFTQVPAASDGTISAADVVVSRAMQTEGSASGSGSSSGSSSRAAVLLTRINTCMSASCGACVTPYFAGGHHRGYCARDNHA